LLEFSQIDHYLPKKLDSCIGRWVLCLLDKGESVILLYIAIFTYLPTFLAYPTNNCLCLKTRNYSIQTGKGLYDWSCNV